MPGGAGACGARPGRRGAAPFTAVFLADDQKASGVRRALREAGTRTPGRVAVAGFDGIPGEPSTSRTRWRRSGRTAPRQGAGASVSRRTAAKVAPRCARSPAGWRPVHRPSVRAQASADAAAVGRRPPVVGRRPPAVGGSLLPAAVASAPASVCVPARCVPGRTREAASAGIRRRPGRPREAPPWNGRLVCARRFLRLPCGRRYRAPEAADRPRVCK
ncbi:substrate-binding domain-containing protein [Streptomyces sp. NPDC057854]|uniref:substrate-binding domain-containing protein n=1 Tax=unclassified Streptomyces TaxID=2593676 RepID=UPI0036D2068D